MESEREVAGAPRSGITERLVSSPRRSPLRVFHAPRRAVASGSSVRAGWFRSRGARFFHRRLPAGGQPVWLALISALTLLGLVSQAACRRYHEPPPVPELRQLIDDLSEPGGYFDTDNLISNETSYVQAVDRLAPTRGVYLGVGPEQNFNYIARLRPSWAFIVDIRRDNLLQHLMYNAIFEHADSPYEYLCWLFSRPIAEMPPRSAGMEPLLVAFGSTAPDAETFSGNLEAIFDHITNRLRIELSTEDREVIRSIYATFFREQLEIRFRSHGRPPMPYHPSYRALVTARGRQGREAHFLASPQDYLFVRDLARRRRLVPIVGDFSGSHALRALGDFLRKRGESVGAFYVSNVEYYLIRAGEFESYVENLRSLPWEEDSLFIRAYFNYGYQHPAGLSGHRSTTVLQRSSSFFSQYDAGAYRNYWDVCTRDYMP